MSTLFVQQTSKPKRSLSTKSSDSSGSGSGYVYPHQNATLTYTLSFDPVENKLQVRIKQLSGFRMSDPDGVMAPYIKVRGKAM